MRSQIQKLMNYVARIEGVSQCLICVVSDTNTILTLVITLNYVIFSKFYRCRYVRVSVVFRCPSLYPCIIINGLLIFIFSYKVDLEFKAKFLFSAGSIYKAPPLLVKTVLTSEESKGTLKSGRGMRLDEEGKCRLVGVSTVDPIDDFLMNSFLGLPTECLAELNAVISISSS